MESRRRSARLGRRLRLFVLLLSAWILSSAGLVLLLRWGGSAGIGGDVAAAGGEGAPAASGVGRHRADRSQYGAGGGCGRRSAISGPLGFDTTEIIAAVERHLGWRTVARRQHHQSTGRAQSLSMAGRSFLRKGLRSGFTGLIELAWPKRRILEMYLNFAETGSAVGVAVASRHYFREGPGRQDGTKAALLAAVLPNPLVYRVDNPSAFVGSVVTGSCNRWTTSVVRAISTSIMRGDDVPSPRPALVRSRGAFCAHSRRQTVILNASGGIRGPRWPKWCQPKAIVIATVGAAFRAAALNFVKADPGGSGR